MLIKFFCLLGVLVGACNAKLIFPKQFMDGRIVGGDEAKIEDFPHQVLMEYNGMQLCGGSIIANDTIVTAGHCTYGLSAKSMTIRAGSSIKGQGTQVRVKNFVRHEKFDMDKIDYDISILFLEEELEFSDTINSIELPEQDEPLKTGTPSIVTGWGTLSENGMTPSKLQKVTIPIVDPKICLGKYQTYHMQITDRMLCAGDVKNGGKDACQGDSGGPLKANGKLVGIVSWGNGCARQNFPGVYTKVASLREWISGVVGF